MIPVALKKPYRRFRTGVDKRYRRWVADWEAIVPMVHPNRLELKGLRNRHRGCLGFLIGSGPSVRPADLDQLSGQVTFCCNRFYLAYDRTTLRPTYLCSADPVMIRDFGEEMLSRAESPVVFMSVIQPKLAGEYQWVEIDSEGPFFFTRNALRPIHPGGGTLIAALQLGYWMGIRKFVLYGVDHNFPKVDPVPVGTDGRSTFVTGEGNHFIADYRAGKPWVAPWADEIEGAFQRCDIELRREGGWLINASRASQLPNIERVPFEIAIERVRRVE
jgi:hypothetical protein